MYIRQAPLFSFDTLMQYQPKTRLAMLFEALDMYPLAQRLSRKSVRGPKGYSVVAMLRALMAKQVYGIPTMVQLVERLNQDLVFAYDCGFSTASCRPSVPTISRFFQLVSETDGLNSLFQSLVQKAMDSGLITGDVVAIDSSIVEAYEKAVPKTKVVDDEKRANWGAKRDTNGNQISWFGYKMHIATDTKSELPLALVLTPANRNDATQAIPLMNGIPVKPRYYCMDMGYDTKEIYETASQRQAQAIIPLNRRGEKQPPAGLDENRTPVCSMGYAMVYWGCDAQRGVLKFRCPHVCGKVDCPQGSSWCSDSNYGLVVKKEVSEDPRSFCTPHRGTREWEKLYDQRTSVERVFSRIKEQLGATVLRVRGFNKVKAHLLLCCIILVAGTLAVNRKNAATKTA